MATKSIKDQETLSMKDCNDFARQYIECTKERNYTYCTHDKFLYKWCVNIAIYEQKNREIKLLEALAKSTGS